MAPGRKLSHPGKDPRASDASNKSKPSQPSEMNMVLLKKQLHEEIAKLAQSAKDGSAVGTQQPSGVTCPNSPQASLGNGRADSVRNPLFHPDVVTSSRPGVQSCLGESTISIPPTNNEVKPKEQETALNSTAVGCLVTNASTDKREQLVWPRWRENCASVTQKLRFIGKYFTGVDTSLNPIRIHEASKIVEKGVHMILVRLKNIAPTTFQMVLLHMYTRRFSDDLPVSVLTEVYRVAKYRFHMPELEKQCFELLRNNKSLEENVLRLFQLARELGDSELERFSLQNALKNATSILKSKDFLSLSAEEICALMENDALNVDSEIAVFTASVRWATNLCVAKGKSPVPMNITNELGKVLYTARLPLLTSDEFNLHVLPTDILPRNHSVTLCRYFMPPFISLPPDFPFLSKPRSPTSAGGTILHEEDQSVFTVTAVKVEPKTALVEEVCSDYKHSYAQYLIETSPKLKRQLNDYSKPQLKKTKVEDDGDALIVPTSAIDRPIIHSGIPWEATYQFACVDSDSGRPNTASTYVVSPPPVASQGSPSPKDYQHESTNNPSDIPSFKEITLQTNRVVNDSINSHSCGHDDDDLHQVQNSQNEQSKESKMQIASFKIPSLIRSNVAAFPVTVWDTYPTTWPLTSPTKPMEINAFFAKLKVVPKLECVEEVVAHLIVTDKSRVEPPELFLPNIKMLHLHLNTRSAARAKILGKGAQKEVFDTAMKSLFSSRDSLKNIIFVRDKAGQRHFENMWSHRVGVKITLNGVTILETGIVADREDKKHKLTCALLPYDSKPHRSLLGLIGKNAPHNFTLAGNNLDARSFQFLAGPLMENLSILKIFSFEGVRKFVRSCPNLKELRLDGRRKLTFFNSASNPDPTKPMIRLDDDLNMFDTTCKLRTLVLSEMLLEIGNKQNLKKRCEMTSPTFLFCRFEPVVFKYFERLFPRLKEIHERKFQGLTRQVLNMKHVKRIVIWGAQASSQNESLVEDLGKTQTGVNQADVRAMMKNMEGRSSREAFILKRLPISSERDGLKADDRYLWDVTEFRTISSSCPKLMKIAYETFGYSHFMDFDAFIVHFQRYYS